MVSRSWYLLAITLVALSVGASYAHVLELPAKLSLGAADYLTVQQIYRWFGPVGSVLEPASIAVTIGLLIAARGRPSFRYNGAATALLVVALATWFVVVSPMNAEFSRWVGGVPASWTSVRARWEWGHVAVFALKLVGLVVLIAGALAGVSWREPPHVRPDVS